MQTVQAPVLKWQHGGCYSSWCETGWYSSPAVADLDGNGTMEVIGATYSLFILNGEDGSLQRSVDTARQPGLARRRRRRRETGMATWRSSSPSGGGYVSVYDHQGGFEPGWPQQPASNEFRSLAVADLDGDGDMEIAVGQARLDRINVWVLEHDGQTPPWLAPGDQQRGLRRRPIQRQYRPGRPGRRWRAGSGRPLRHHHDLRLRAGWQRSSPPTRCTTTIRATTWTTGARCRPTSTWSTRPGAGDRVTTQFTARANFANGPANVVDVNGDGVNEVVVIGDVHDCHTSPYTDLYNGAVHLERRPQPLQRRWL